MKKTIKVSAHLFKTKESATQEVDTILSHRRDRVNKINLPIVEKKKKVELIENEIVSLQRQISQEIVDCEKKNIVESNNTKSLIGSIHKKYEFSANKLKKDLEKEQKELEIRIVNVRKERASYRHSNKHIQAKYVCKGKCSQNSQWVFVAS